MLVQRSTSQLYSTGTLEKCCPQRSYVDFSWVSLHLPPRPHLGPSCDKGSKGFAAKLLPIIPLNSKVETKINIGGKPCHMLVIFGATFSTWNYTFIEQYIPQSESFQTRCIRWSPQIIFVSTSIITLGFFTENHRFLLCDVALVDLFGRALLSKWKS